MPDSAYRWPFASLVVCLAALFPAMAQAQAPEPPANPSSPPTYPRFHLGGFADLELHTSSDGLREGLDVAEIDLYPTAQLSDDWSALAEVVARHDWQSAGSGPRDKLVAELELERLFLSYQPSDRFRLEVGETHTGIVRWNEREHRSRLLQTPIDLPAIARRPQDDGAWPLRFVGVWISGRSNDAVGFSYGIGVGHGSAKSRDDVSILRNDAPAALATVAFEPARWRGVELALALYAQRIPTAEPMRELDGTIALGYTNGGAELRAEWARMVHTPIHSEVRYRSTGFYVLASHRLAGKLAAFRPYLLLDRLAVAPGEEYLQEVPSENAWATGIRWDATRRFTVKGEYRSQRGTLSDRESVFGVQFGLSF
jgi:hypothetical protein